MSDRTVDAVDPENWRQTEEYQQYLRELHEADRPWTVEEMDEIIAMLRS